MQRPTAGQIIPIDGGGGAIRFQWNPREITGPTASAQYAVIAVAGREFPYLEYSNGQQSHIRFDLEYSTASDNGSLVKSNFQALNALTKPSVRGASMSRPPRVMFIFGSFLRERCVVVEVQPNFSKVFHEADLMPLHAKIGVTLWRLG